MAAVKHRLISAAFGAMSATRLDALLERWTRGVGAILMFHHVRPPIPDAFRPNALLEITPDFLDSVLLAVRRRGWAIVPTDEVPERLRARARTPFVALTFDDGYRDNVEHALPVLDGHDAPWTLYVTTDFADGDGRLWWVELEEVVRRSERVRATVGGVALDLPAGDAAAKTTAFGTLYRALRAGPEGELRSVLASLGQAVELDTAALTRQLCLEWPELATLAARRGATIGAHTLSHPMLAKHPAEVAQREIVEGRRVIAERLGVPVRHLAYPVGDPGSAGSREFAIAREAGFATAVTTRPGHLFPAHADHLHALPRVSVNGLHQNEAALGSLLSGLPFALWNRGRRVNVV